jgi:hypothetical protein
MLVRLSPNRRSDVAARDTVCDPTLNRAPPSNQTGASGLRALIHQARIAKAGPPDLQIEEACRRAAAAGCQLILLPELHEGAYFCQLEDVDCFDQAGN